MRKKGIYDPLKVEKIASKGSTNAEYLYKQVLEIHNQPERNAFRK